MAGPKKPPPPDAEAAPWRPNTVKGVVPPGRRLSDEKRPLTWSASGVKGVTPPGTMKIGESSTARWSIDRGSDKKKKRERPAPAKAPEPKAPKEGDLKAFLDALAEFVRDHPPDRDAAMVDLASFIGQSRAVFEIVVCFTLLTALVGPDANLRARFQFALERGAKTYFNLARRLDKKVKAPRGLVPETVDPLFYDLPGAAYQLPIPYALDGFLGILELLRGDRRQDRQLVELATKLRERHLAGRSFGDRPLERMFPWSPPTWAPRSDL